MFTNEGKRNQTQTKISNLKVIKFFFVNRKISCLTFKHLILLRISKIKLRTIKKIVK